MPFPYCRSPSCSEQIAHKESPSVEHPRNGFDLKLKPGGLGRPTGLAAGKDVWKKYEKQIKQ